jgi:hypothetical protein
LQERLTEDVSDIAEWSREDTELSREKTETEQFVFAVRAVRHGIDKVSAKRFRVPENLNTFVNILEEIVSRSVKRIPQQATKDSVKRAITAAIKDLGLGGAGGSGGGRR